MKSPRIVILFLPILLCVPFKAVYPQDAFAEPQTQEADKKNPTSEILLLEASVLYEKGNVKKAITLLEKSINLDPKYTEAYYRLGIIYVDMQQYDKSVEYFKKVIEINPGFTKAYLNLGGSYGHLKKYNEALKYLDKALALDKQNPKIYYNIGLTFLAAQQMDKASYFLSKAKQLATEFNDKVILEKIEKLYQK